MSIFGYILLGIWGAAYLALIIRRMNRRHRVIRISGEMPRREVPRPDLEVPQTDLEASLLAPRCDELLPRRRANG